MFFTSDRDGDLELYMIDESGSDLKRVTRKKAHDGVAFFSSNCSEIV
jgi:Tol biopolymer transport system component